jgi:hypothetical protein
MTEIRVDDAGRAQPYAAASRVNHPLLNQAHIDLGDLPVHLLVRL